MKPSLKVVPDHTFECVDATDMVNAISALDPFNDPAFWGWFDSSIVYSRWMVL